MNRKYYGIKVALYIAAIMFVSIVVTALILHTGFYLFDAIPEGSRKVKEVTQFAIDYTFWFNLAFLFVAATMIYLNYRYNKTMEDKGHHHSSSKVKVIAVYSCLTLIGLGLIFYFYFL